MRTLRLFPLLALLSLLFVTCKNDATEPTLGEGAVSGLITDAMTGTVVTGATVTSQGPVATGQYVQSDDGGRFLLKFNLDSTGTLLLSISRQGYRDTSLMVAVLSGSTTPITVRLNRTGKKMTIPACILLIRRAKCETQSGFGFCKAQHGGRGV